MTMKPIIPLTFLHTTTMALLVVLLVLSNQIGHASATGREVKTFISTPADSSFRKLFQILFPIEISEADSCIITSLAVSVNLAAADLGLVSLTLEPRNRSIPSVSLLARGVCMRFKDLIATFEDNTPVLATPCGITTDGSSFKPPSNDLTGSTNRFDIQGTWTLLGGFINPTSPGPIPNLNSWTLTVTCMETEPPVEVLPCGPSLLTTACPNLKCCDATTGAVGPDCCGTTPYNPDTLSCCEDGSLVEGTEAACVPSVEPTSFPSSQPSTATCDKGDPCKYKLEEDERTGFMVTKRYYPICIQEESTEYDVYYRQKCYEESIAANLCVGDRDPYKDDRMIAICGCCTLKEDLSNKLGKVKGKTNICEGGLDCIDASTPFKLSKSVKKTKFLMCIDGEEKYKKNFYVPDEDDDTAQCGPCELPIR